MKVSKKFLATLLVPLSLQTLYCNAQTILNKEVVEKNITTSNPIDYNKFYDFYIKKELYDLYEDILEEYNEQKLFSNMKEWEEDKIDILEDFNEIKVYCNNPKCNALLDKLNKLLVFCDEDLKGKDNKANINKLKDEVFKEIKAL